MNDNDKSGEKNDDDSLNNNEENADRVKRPNDEDGDD